MTSADRAAASTDRGPRHRRERERQVTRQHILDAARELYAAGGYPAVTMRQIAERIEYTAPAIYSYFPSRDAIFMSLATEGLRLLDAATAGSPASDLLDDLLDDLRVSYWRYYEFSRAHPEYFTLIFVDPSVPPLDVELTRLVQQMAVAGTGRLQRCIDAGVLPAGTDPSLASQTLWAAIHGAAVIRLWGRVESEQEMDRFARAVLDNAIAGLRAGGLRSEKGVAAGPVGEHDGRRRPRE